MVGHQLGQDLILGLDFLFQVGDPLLLDGMVGWHLRLEGGCAVLEELLLPAVEDWAASRVHRSSEMGLLVQQMPPQDSDLLFWRIVLP